MCGDIMDLITVGTCITLFVTVFTFFYKLIIVPLSETIKDLKMMIDEIRKDISRENEIRNRFEIRLSLAEEKINRLEGAKK